jgi:hypothetical protein
VNGVYIREVGAKSAGFHRMLIEPFKAAKFAERNYVNLAAGGNLARGPTDG